MPGAAPEGDPPPDSGRKMMVTRKGWLREPEEDSCSTRPLPGSTPPVGMHRLSAGPPYVTYHLSVDLSIIYPSSVYHLSPIDHLSIYTSSSIIYHLLSLACHIYLSSIYHLSIIHLSINHLSIYRLSSLSLSLSVSLPPSLCLFQS